LSLPNIVRRSAGQVETDHGSAGWRRLAVVRSLTGIPSLMLLETQDRCFVHTWFRITVLRGDLSIWHERRAAVRISFSILVCRSRISIGCDSAVLDPGACMDALEVNIRRQGIH